MIYLRLALRSIKNSRRLSFLFVMNLVLGLLGFSLLEGFRASVEHTLDANSRTYLGADLNVSGRRHVTEQELKLIREQVGASPVVEMYESYSMAVRNGRSRLVQLRAVEGDFPFYGHMMIDGTTAESTGMTTAQLKTNTIWVGPEILVQLRAQVGDVLRLGQREFQIAGVIRRDVGSLWGGFALAPRIYLQWSDLKASDLISEGSVVTYSRLYQLSDRDSEAAARNLAKNFSDNGLRVVGHKRASEQAGRFLAYFNDYLSLTAIIALLLSSVGAVFLVRSWLEARKRDFAILGAIGFAPGATQALLVIEIVILSALSALIVVALVPLLLPGLAGFASQFMSVRVDPHFPPSVLFVTFGLGVMGTLLVILPEFQRLKNLSPALLFQEAGSDAMPASRGSWVWLVPALIFFAALSVYQAHSLRVGGLFFAGVLSSLGLLYVLGGIVLQFLARVRVRGLGWSMTFRNIGRNRFATLSSFIALGLGATLLNLIPQIQSSLANEIQRPEVSAVPSLFLFDIQDEQVEAVKKLLTSEGVEIKGLSPMVRARLESINGVSIPSEGIAESRFFREQEQEDRTRSRMYNLSYRAELSESETLVEGRLFSGTYSGVGPAEVSLESRFAERLRVSLGDILTFDIQGVPVDGRVVSLRRVKWTSFQPNFFVQFQPGVLEMAPKVWLGGVTRLTPEIKVHLQDRLAETIPNISIIDVSTVIEQMLVVIGLIGWVLTGMAGASLVTGSVVLFAIVIQQVRSRSRDVAVLKAIGGGFSSIRAMLVREVVVTGAAAGAIGALLGVGLSFGISKFIFEGVFAPNLVAPIAVFVGLLMLCGLVGLLGVRFVLEREKTF